MFKFDRKMNRNSIRKFNRKVGNSSKRASVLNWEGQLEERQLLAKFSGFAQQLSNKLIDLQTVNIPQTVLSNDLPSFGDQVKNLSTNKSLFSDTTNTLNNISTETDNVDDVKQSLLSNFGSAITIQSIQGDLLTFQLTGTKVLKFDKFDAGLPTLAMSSANSFNAKLNYTLNVKAGVLNGSFVYDTNIADEVSFSLVVDNADLPVLNANDAKLGILYLNGTPNGSGPAVNLTFKLDLGPNKATVSGHTDIRYALTLGFQKLTESKFNPKLTSNFRLNWQFGTDSNANVPSSDFGTSPTVEFNNLSLDVGAMTKDFGIESLNNILDKAEPIFSLARTLNQPLPGLKEMSAQIKGLVGDTKTNVNEIDDLIDALKDPSIVKILNAGANFTEPQYKDIIKKVVDVISFAGSVVAMRDGINTIKSVGVDFGDYTIGGGGANLRLNGPLSGISPTSSTKRQLAVNSNEGSLIDDLKNRLAENYLSSDLLDDSGSVFALILGSEDVDILEYKRPVRPDSFKGDITFVSQNFAVGIVPANFQVGLNFSDIGFNLNFGFSSRGFVQSKGNLGDLIKKGVFVGSGEDNPIFVATVKLHVDLAVGADAELIEARVGVSGFLKADAKAYFPGSGKTYFDQLLANGNDCPLAGKIDVTAGVELFASAGLNLDLQTIINGVKQLLEAAIAKNPEKFVAKKLLEISTPYLEKAGVSPADIANLKKYADDPSTAFKALEEGFGKNGTKISESFKQQAKKYEKAATDARDRLISSSPTLQKGSDAISDIGKRLGIPEKPPVSFGLTTSFDSRTTIFETKPPIISWHFGCRAEVTADAGGNSNRIGATFVPEFGSISGDTLTLYVGELGSLRNMEPDRTDETVLIRPADTNDPSNGSIMVIGFGYSRVYNGIRRVIANAGSNKDVIDLLGTGVIGNLDGGDEDDRLVAGLHSSTLLGASGRDTLYGSNSPDFIDGQDGDDTIEGHGGDDFIFGGKGNDKAFGDFAEGSTSDTSSDPVLHGNDSIYGGDGNDFIYVGPGDDRASGGQGNDSIRGGSGQDSLFGDEGDDNINGGSENDAIDGGMGTDLIFGEGGDDIITCGDIWDVSNDVATGDDGNDRMFGTAGNNFLFGQEGNDTIYGFSGQDEIQGGDGDDLLDGGDHNDSLIGGLGNDSIYGGNGSDEIGFAAEDGIDLTEGEGGTDILVFTGSASNNSNFRVYLQGARVQLEFRTDDKVDGTTIERIVLRNGSNTTSDNYLVENLFGSDVRDLEIRLSATSENIIALVASALNDSILVNRTSTEVKVAGLTHVTSIFGASRQSSTVADLLSILGSSGNDNLKADSSLASHIGIILDGGEGDDFISGAITAMGGAGDDEIVGTAFSDILLGGLGKDSLEGLAGDDLILGDADGTGAGTGMSTNHGDLSPSMTPFAISAWVAAGGKDMIKGGEGNDSLNGGFADDMIYGDAGNDLIGFLALGSNPLLPTAFEEPGADSIWGSTGADSIDGAAGNDEIYGEAGADLIRGGLDNDKIWGGEDVDTINGNEGNDSIYGDAGTDSIFGDAGNDSIWGGDDADRIEGNTGADTIHGDAGADLIFGNEDGDEIYGDAGADKLFGNDGDDKVWGGTESDEIAGGLGQDTAFGDAGTDLIYGNDGNDELSGGADSDTVYGGLGADVMFGDEGADLMCGGPASTEGADPTLDGNDTMFGGTGNDAVFGDYGNDFVNGGEGNDNLWGNEGNDALGVIEFRGALYQDFGNDSMVGGVGNDVIAGSIDPQDGNDAMFGQAGNDTLWGGAGGDMIYGGEDSDILLGGTPETANTVHVPRDPSLPQDGNDTMLGGNGFDEVDGGNGNNLMDAGDDGIRETVLGGLGNDMAYNHMKTDPANYDILALDGGFNHKFHDGYLLEPPVPVADCEFVTWVIPTMYYTGYKELHTGDIVEHPPLKYRTTPNNGPNGPVKAPKAGKGKPIQGGNIKKPAAKPGTIRTGRLFAGKSTTVGSLASAKRALKN